MARISRRQFLQESLAGLGAASLANFAMPQLGQAQASGIKALVVVQLLGGLDPWLAFPYTRDDQAIIQYLRGDYARIPLQPALLEMTPGLGVHPGMRNLIIANPNSFKVVMQTGNAFNVGADGSHDVASLLMMTGGYGSVGNRYGWPARLYDAGVALQGLGGHSASFACQTCTIPPFRTTTYENFDITSQAFGARQGGATNAKHVDIVLRALNGAEPDRPLSAVEKKFRGAQKGMFVAEDDMRETLKEGYRSRLYDQYTVAPSIFDTPPYNDPKYSYRKVFTSFGQRIRNVAQKLNQMKASGQSGNIIFVVSLGNFDLHGDGQSWDVFGNVLMWTLGETLKTFRDDLKDPALNLDNNVVTLCTSEFGRQILGNGKGTDHGVGYPLMVTGGRVRGGVYGDLIPAATLKSLTDQKRTASWPREVSQERIIVDIVEKHFGLSGKIAFPSPLFEKIPVYSDLQIFSA